MNPLNQLPLRLVVGTALAALALPASAAVVYDNTQNDTFTSAFRTGFEYGDEIKLAGTDRFVTEFLIGYFGDFTPPESGTGRIRIYTNDGSDAIAGPQVALRPKTLLWESAPFALAPNNQAVMVTPNITVPDDFTWTIKFDGLPNTLGHGAALSISNPVSVGGVLSGGRIGSYNDFWILNNPADPESWALNVLSGNIPGNFYAQVTAVATFEIEEAHPDGNSLVLTWKGGLPPFRVQRRDSLTNGAWTDVVVNVAGQTATVPLAGAAGFLRVVDAGGVIGSAGVDQNQEVSHRAPR